MPKNQIQITIEKTSNGGYIVTRTTDSGTVRNAYTGKGVAHATPASATMVYQDVEVAVLTDLS